MFARKDLPRHQGLRNQLVEILRQKGIQNEQVLQAIARVPRHLFMDSALEIHAYEDKAFPIAAEQTISQPYTVAFQTELLQLQAGQKVLEIGTGSGYQAAVLTLMGIQVYSVERQHILFKQTQLLLPKLGFSIKKLHYGDGYEGLPEFAPFDGILVTAGAEETPKNLLKQLKIGGKLVIPLGNQEVQTMSVFERISEKEFKKTEHGLFRFVPLLKDKK